MTLYGRSTIANVETRGQRAQREFWQRCDELLDTGGFLAADYDEIALLEQQLVAASARSAGSAGGFAGAPGDVYVHARPDLIESVVRASGYSRWMVDRLRDGKMWLR